MHVKNSKFGANRRGTKVMVVIAISALLFASWLLMFLPSASDSWIELSVYGSDTQNVEPGSIANYMIRVENKDDVGSHKVFIEADDAPSGWEAYLSKSSMDLSPNENDYLFLSVKTPVHATSSRFAYIGVRASDIYGNVTKIGTVTWIAGTVTITENLTDIVELNETNKTHVVKTYGELNRLGKEEIIPTTIATDSTGEATFQLSDNVSEKLNYDAKFLITPDTEIGVSDYNDDSQSLNFTEEKGLLYFLIPGTATPTGDEVSVLRNNKTIIALNQITNKEKLLFGVEVKENDTTITNFDGKIKVQNTTLSSMKKVTLDRNGTIIETRDVEDDIFEIILKLGGRGETTKEIDEKVEVKSEEDDIFSLGLENTGNYIYESGSHTIELVGKRSTGYSFLINNGKEGYIYTIDSTLNNEITDTFDISENGKNLNLKTTGTDNKTFDLQIQKDGKTFKVTNLNISNANKLGFEVNKTLDEKSPIIYYIDTDGDGTLDKTSEKWVDLDNGDTQADIDKKMDDKYGPEPAEDKDEGFPFALVGGIIGILVILIIIGMIMKGGKKKEEKETEELWKKLEEEVPPEEEVPEEEKEEVPPEEEVPEEEKEEVPPEEEVPEEEKEEAPPEEEVPEEEKEEVPPEEEVPEEEKEEAPSEEEVPEEEREEVPPEEEVPTEEVDVEELYAEGVECFKSGEYDEAIENFDKTIAADPNHDKAWFNKGFVLRKLDRDEEAIECFDKAVEINPDYEKAWYSKGFTLRKLERYSEALESFEKALEINPDYENAKRGIEICREELGLNEEEEEVEFEVDEE